MLLPVLRNTSGGLAQDFSGNGPMSLFLRKKKHKLQGIAREEKADVT